MSFTISDSCLSKVQKLCNAHAFAVNDGDLYVYGINEYDTGTLQTNGFYIDGKMTPFVSWADDYHTKYTLYHGKILEDIFKAIFTIGISYDEIVKVVEERDMWYNS